MNGSIKTNASLEASFVTIKATPVTSTVSGFEVLTRNISTGVVEKTSVSSLIDNSTLVHRSGDEGIAGAKTFSGITIFESAISGSSAVFSGNLSSLNFSGQSSGSNTGDETQSSIISKIGFTPANESNVVHATGAETIAGVKNFTGNTSFGGVVSGTTASFSGALAASNLSGMSSGTNTGDETKATILGKIGFSPANDADVVHKTGDQSIGGIKSFSGKVAIGTSNPGNNQLAVKGTIKAQAVKVDPTAWADYVFDSSYNLMSLGEVEKHIIDKKHLPGVPSEAEVKREGIELGAMNALLLRKIEELTLYMIEKDKKLNKANQKIEELAKKVASIEAKSRVN